MAWRPPKNAFQTLIIDDEGLVCIHKKGSMQESIYFFFANITFAVVLCTHPRNVHIPWKVYGVPQAGLPFSLENGDNWFHIDLNGVWIQHYCHMFAKHPMTWTRVHRANSYLLGMKGIRSYLSIYTISSIYSYTVYFIYALTMMGGGVDFKQTKQLKLLLLFVEKNALCGSDMLLFPFLQVLMATTVHRERGPPLL